jgi:hypothetical protein
VEAPGRPATRPRPVTRTIPKRSTTGSAQDRRWIQAERGARPAAHVRTWSRVAIVVAVIGAIATLAAAIGALVKVDGGSTPAPARLAISRIVLPAPGATPKIIRVAGTGTAGQRIRCFAKPVDGGPVEGATPTSSAVRPTLGGAPDPAGTGAPRRPAEYWYVSDLALADRTGAWQATVAVDADHIGRWIFKPLLRRGLRRPGLKVHVLSARGRALR